MPFSVGPHRRFPVPCSVTYNADPFLKLSQSFFLGFWLLIPLLVLSSGPVYAGWVLASGVDKAGMTVYVDPDSIRRKGNLVKIWSLWDYKTVQNGVKGSYLSQQSQIEFDCAEERYRVLSVADYSRNMASGNLVYSSSFDLTEVRWNPVFPGSVSLSVWKFACGKK
jgi:hypothetical protein